MFWLHKLLIKEVVEEDEEVIATVALILNVLIIIKLVILGIAIIL